MLHHSMQDVGSQNSAKQGATMQLVFKKCQLISLIV